MTTLDHPEDRPRSITKDKNIKEYREARGVIDEQMGRIVSVMLNYRKTIERQAMHIAQLQKADYKAKATYDDLEKEVLRWRSNAKVEHEKYVAAKEMIARLEDKLAQSARPSMAETFVEAMLDTSSRRKRLNRIATGILNRINDGHYAIARELAITLMEESSNDRNVGANKDSNAARPNDRTQTVRSLGIPYLGE